MTGGGASDHDEPVHDARVDAVLSDLEQLADLPVESHLEVYEAVHAKLREVLQTAGQAPGPRPPTPPGPTPPRPAVS